MHSPRSRLTRTFESVLPISCFLVPITRLKRLASLQDVSRPSFEGTVFGLITLPKYYCVLWASGERCRSLDSEVPDKRQKQHFWVPNMACLADILSWEIGTGKAMFCLISSSFLGSNHLFWFSCLLCVCEYVSVHVSKGMWVPAETRRGCSIIGSPGAGVKGSCKLSFFHEYWEQNSSSLKEQQMFLTTSHLYSFLKNITDRQTHTHAHTVCYIEGLKMVYWAQIECVFQLG